MPKPFAKLNRADLVEARVWEWVPDDAADTGDEATDESYVRPTTLAAIPLVPFGQFVVASSIELKSGAAFPGIAEVTVANGEIVVDPSVVFLLDRQLRIPGMETNRLLTRYTKTAANHPAAWRLAVRVEGEGDARTGPVKGGDMKDAVRAGLDALLALKALRK